jgi:uncharacterized protein YndB with AHSA1/START domain
MPTQKDPSGRRFVAVETEVPGSAEEVWQAVATGAGITSWFVPSRVEERKNGSLVLDFGPGMESTGEIQAWDPPRRFTVENKEGMGPGSPTVTDEWTIEAKAGGTCRVRVVHSWLASTDDWNKHFEAVEQGWPSFFRILRATSCTSAVSRARRSRSWLSLPGRRRRRGPSSRSRSASPGRASANR